MAKAIFQNNKGLSRSNRNDDNRYSVGTLIDPSRDPGYLRPAFSGTAITATLESSVRDMAYYLTTPWVIDTKELYSIVTGAATSQRDFSGSGIGTGLGLVSYKTHVGGSDSAHTFEGLFYIGTIKAGLYYYAGGDQFDDDWLSSVPASATAFSDASAHPHILWNGYLIIGDGQYIVSFDGQTGDNGTYTDKYFDVGNGWYIKSFFKYLNYLGIVVRDQYDTSSDILLIDGSSTTEAVKRVSVKEKVIAGANLNNELVFVTQDLNGKCWLKSLGDNGLEPIIDIKFENASTSSTYDIFSAPVTDKEIDIYDNKLAFSCKVGTTPFIFVFGKDAGGETYITTKQFAPTGQNITVSKTINGVFYIGSYTTTSYYLQAFTTGNATATLKYPFKDFGQKVRVNYVKVYFKPLESGDSITVGLDTNYGTSTSLGTISYATYGAITEKRFELKKFCHAFRPTVSWTSGGTAISKIIVDYDFVDDI